METKKGFAIFKNQYWLTETQDWSILSTDAKVLNTRESAEQVIRALPRLKNASVTGIEIMI